MPPRDHDVLHDVDARVRVLEAKEEARDDRIVRIDERTERIEKAVLLHGGLASRVDAVEKWVGTERATRSWFLRVVIGAAVTATTGALVVVVLAAFGRL